ncbi:hypothetical protein JN00_0314 [Metamycoplasma subdolum]|uniref:Uncharacterized protein n=2 Tax=Metamycoplasma subdolum TaxID=92407 RepID=A0A3M0A226_9BACT|nr:hypothetical protein [Metamycoplasma subdolum]RMA78484.1 hypothetical protein JN00_0314 [Metamycoplasma subdolum]
MQEANKDKKQTELVDVANIERPSEKEIKKLKTKKRVLTTFLIGGIIATFISVIAIPLSLNKKDKRLIRIAQEDNTSSLNLRNTEIIETISEGTEENPKKSILIITMDKKTNIANKIFALESKELTTGVNLTFTPPFIKRKITPRFKGQDLNTFYDTYYGKEKASLSVNHEEIETNKLKNVATFDLVDFFTKYHKSINKNLVGVQLQESLNKFLTYTTFKQLSSISTSFTFVGKKDEKFIYNDMMPNLSGITIINFIQDVINQIKRSRFFKNKWISYESEKSKIDPYVLIKEAKFSYLIKSNEEITNISDLNFDAKVVIEVTNPDFKE